MKCSLMLPAKPNLQWQLARQLGIDYAVTKAAPELTGMPDPSDYNSLKIVRDRFEEAGFKLYALEGDEFDMTRIKMGLPGRDEDIEKYCAMLTNMGKLGLKLLCFNFMAGVGWYRSKNDLLERGGALTSGFNVADIDNSEPLKMSHEKLWDNIIYFLKAVTPAAEAAGVQMGMHPDDPPIPQLMGYPRILISADAYRRVLREVPSPALGVTFCQATFRAMGEDVFSLLEEFGEKVFFFHFRDITGVSDNFVETFHDNGPTDMPKLLAHLKKCAPDCLIRPDHTPTMAGESNESFGYTMQGNLFATGYLRGILETLDCKQN